MLFDKVIAFDNFKQKIILISNIKTDDLEGNYEKACNDLKEIADLIKKGKKAEKKPFKDEDEDPENAMETKSGTPKELKISLLHGLGSTNPLPTLFGTFSIPQSSI